MSQCVALANTPLSRRRVSGHPGAANCVVDSSNRSQDNDGNLVLPRGNQDVMRALIRSGWKVLALNSGSSNGLSRWLLAGSCFVLAVLPVPLQAAAPANDSLEANLLLAGSSGNLAGGTSGATVERGEPVHATGSGGSVWYRWRSYRWPQNLNATNIISVAASSFAPRLAVYRLDGDSLAFSNLTKVASVASTTKSAGVKFKIEAGATYYIAVASSTAGSGSFSITWKLIQGSGPGVDLVVVPTSITQATITRTFGEEDCEVLDGCTVPGNNRLLSLSFNIANRGAADLILGNPEESPYATNFACNRTKVFYGLHRYVLKNSKGQIVKTAEPGEHCLRDDLRENSKAKTNALYSCSLTQGLQAGWLYESTNTLACHFLDISDVAAGAYTLEIVTDPNDYILETVETNNTARIPVTISPDCTAPPPNDQRENAVVLTGPITANGVNSECASAEPGEERHAGVLAGRSVWYRWTAPYTGTAVVSTEGSNFDTALEVQGPAENGVNGPSIASNDDLAEGVQQSRLQFQAEQGQNYWFVVDGYNLQGGEVRIAVNPAGNDLFLNAQILSGLSGSASGNNRNASKETGEPVVGGDAGGHSVWYSWTAPINGGVNLSTEGTPFKTLLGVYQGTVVNRLTAVTGTATKTPTGQSKFRFTAQAGKTYLFVVDGSAGANGLYSFSWAQDQIRLSGTRQPNGSIVLTILGTQGQVVTIQRSKTLGTWTNLGTLTLGSQPGTFTDSKTDPERAFYRVISQ